MTAHKRVNCSDLVRGLSSCACKVSSTDDNPLLIGGWAETPYRRDQKIQGPADLTAFAASTKARTSAGSVMGLNGFGTTPAAPSAT